MSDKKYISKLQFISPQPNDESFFELIESCCKNGIDWVQLRVKDTDVKVWTDIAKKCKTICNQNNAVFIINDNIEIAKNVNADGVHLGKNDISPSEARSYLGNGYIIGGTANSLEDIEKLVAQNVDYIGLGPFQFTETKKNLSPILGLEGYNEILNKCKLRNIHIPIVAIGGIERKNFHELKETGIHGIAASGLICKLNTENINFKELRQLF
jgi:thiamine-phosphate pyrophosphorylase